MIEEFSSSESTVIKLNLKFYSGTRNNPILAYYANTRSLFSSKSVIVLRRVRQ